MAAQAPPPPPPPQEQKMMVAIDESECSHYALEWAIRNLAPRRLVLFTVQPFSPLPYVPAGSPLGPSMASPELIRAVGEHQRQLSQALIDKAKALCTERGVEAETVIELGDPKETICAAAEKLNVDLLILGSHSRGPIQRFFLGSVSNYCTHHAKCPVLVVKKKEWNTAMLCSCTP